MTDSHRHTILARRRQFLAATLAALAGNGALACRPPQGSPARMGSKPLTEPPTPSSEPQPSAGETSASAPLPPVDSDGDGVPDERDRCPAVVGVDSADSSEAGCPPRPCLSIIQQPDIRFSAKIYFASQQVAIRPQSQPILDEIARALVEHPELQVVVVGHTDSTEAESLAVARTRAVRDYLIQKGVTASRLTVRAEGDQMPAASNRTEQGRQQNRRVEFVVHQPAQR